MRENLFPPCMKMQFHFQLIPLFLQSLNSRNAKVFNEDMQSSGLEATEACHY